MLNLDPVIQLKEVGQVFLTYPSLPDFNLEMNFQPIVDWFRLKNKFCLLHWQAKPFGQRRWGIYDSGNENYVSVKHCEVELRVIPELLQLDENLIKTVPTAVLYFPQSQLVKNGYYSVTPA
jgi:hypothetical protein